MNGQYVHAQLGCGKDGSGGGVGNVMKLQVKKYLLARILESADEVRPGRGEQLQTHFVEASVGADTHDGGLRIGGAGQVKGDDQPGGNRGHGVGSRHGRVISKSKSPAMSGALR